MSETNDGKWCVAHDYAGEYFNGEFFNTKEEAIDNFKKEIEEEDFSETKKRGYFWVGQCFHFSAGEFFNADNIIDNAWELADGEAGEFAEDYLQDVTQEQKDELDNLLMSWVIKHNLEPRFYRIKNSEKVLLTQSIK
jgi:hypothetical protein